MKTFVVPAQITQAKWGVPASVTLAQWIFESSWGTSRLALAANNFFGIKAVAGEEYCEFTTTEDLACGDVQELARFAKYGCALDSFDAHARLLASTRRYAPAMLQLPNIVGFCHQLQMCGYSTSRDPVSHLLDYGFRLISEIRVRNLTQYDMIPPPAAAQEAA